jgi:hypothetical protein
VWKFVGRLRTNLCRNLLPVIKKKEAQLVIGNNQIIIKPLDVLRAALVR